MKKNKQSTIKKTFLIFACLMITSGLILAYLNRSRVKNLIFSDPVTKSNSDDTNLSDKVREVNDVDYGPSSPTDNSQINDQKNNADQANDKPVNAGLSATITNTRVVSSLAQVSVLIGGTTGGNCLLTLSKSGSSDIQKTVSVIVRNGITTCEDFNIPISSLSNGSWGVRVVLESGQTKSKPAEGTLQVGS